MGITKIYGQGCSAFSPIHDAASEFFSNFSSCSSCGRRMALNPRTVPMLSEARPETTEAATY